MLVRLLRANPASPCSSLPRLAGQAFVLPPPILCMGPELCASPSLQGSASTDSLGLFPAGGRHTRSLPPPPWLIGAPSAMRCLMIRADRCAAAAGRMSAHPPPPTCRWHAYAGL